MSANATAISPQPIVVNAPVAVPEPEVEKYQFDADFQTKIAAMVLRDNLFAQRTDGLVRPEYFENTAEAIMVDMAIDYYGKYKKIPGDLAVYGTLIREAIVAKTLKKELAAVVLGHIKHTLWTHDISDRDYVVDQVATFARHQAVAAAMMQATGMLDKRNFVGIEKLMKGALDVGAHADFNAYDFGEMIDIRAGERLDRASGKLAPTGITTGYTPLDERLYHKGWGRRELSVIMGGAKSGKTTALIDFGISAVASGKNVLYATLEVSAQIVAERADANISEIAVNELGTRIHEAKDKVRQFIETTKVRKDAMGNILPPGPGAKFVIHEFPTGSMTVGDLRRLLERYKSRGIMFDMVIVDYADLMAPERYTDNSIENSKSVYVNLRGLAMAENIAVLTATQTNREGFKSAVAKAEHVSEDFNKIRIADIVISINRTDEERGCNQARLFFAACRNQQGGYTIRIEQALDRMKFISKVLGIE